MKRTNHLLQAKSLGLTLIELLVVITIIGILSAVGLATFMNARRRAEDAEAISNVKAAQKAMEQTFSMSSATYDSTDAAASFEKAVFPANITVQENAANSVYCVFTTDTLNQDTDANCTGAAGGVCAFTTTNPTRFCAKNLQ
ncbi:MAG: type II secretion system protein [Candidatus Woesebacteria bacterium]|jgi:prepilin-type N-terminal cleavage/methylation domain-containing protein